MSARAPRRLSPWRRLAALLLDYLVIFAWMTVLAVASLAVNLTMGDSPDVLGAVGPFGAQAVFSTLLTLPVELYLYLNESGPAQATWGKRRMGLVVRSYDGARPGRGQIAIRTVVKLLPWEISHTLIWQMQAVFHRSGYEAEIPTWIFVGLGAVDIAILVYLGTSLFGRQLGRGARAGARTGSSPGTPGSRGRPRPARRRSRSGSPPRSRSGGRRPASARSACARSPREAASRQCGSRSDHVLVGHRRRTGRRAPSGAFPTSPEQVPTR